MKSTRHIEPGLTSVSTFALSPPRLRQSNFGRSRRSSSSCDPRQQLPKSLDYPYSLCMYIYICIYICVYVHMQLYMHICTYVLNSVYISKTYMYMCVNRYVGTPTISVHMHLHLHILADVCIYVKLGMPTVAHHMCRRPEV